MRKLLPLTAALILFGATASMAQSGLNLSWDACQGDGRVESKTFACDTNTGDSFGLYVSLVLPADLPQFAAATAIVDMQFNSPTIPAWWQTGTGQCRVGAITYSSDPNTITNNGSSVCADIWGGSTMVLGVFQPQPNPLIGITNWLRLNGGAAIPAGTEIAYTADGTELVVAKFTITRAKTVGTGSCAGCGTGASFYLHECWVQQPTPLPGFRMTNPASAGSSWCSFNGGNLPTSTENRTWGAVKGLFR